MSGRPPSPIAGLPRPPTSASVAGVRPLGRQRGRQLYPTTSAAVVATFATLETEKVRWLRVDEDLPEAGFA